MSTTWQPPRCSTHRRTLRSHTVPPEPSTRSTGRLARPGPSQSASADELRDDGELIAAVRTGVLAAYGELYRRHVMSARNLARRLTRSPVEADDLVSETFLKVMGALRGGHGPDSTFRAYLLTVLRNTAIDSVRHQRKIELASDVETVRGAQPEAISVPFRDPAVAGLERAFITRAFTQLPLRWQAVLWHTEIEGRAPADVAPVFELKPNGVSALAYRARNGLCAAYLQTQLPESGIAESCRATVASLGAWVRDALATTSKRKVDAHLDRCALCQKRAQELAEANPALVRRRVAA
jgi:RNA polymerase sigma factor (sigma-70 family)